MQSVPEAPLEHAQQMEVLGHAELIAHAAERAEQPRRRGGPIGDAPEAAADERPVQLEAERVRER